MEQPQSEKGQQARNSLPDELKPVFDDLVTDYKFAATKHHGSPFVSYVVLAEIVAEGDESRSRYVLRKKFWTSLLERASHKTDLHAGISPGVYHWVGIGAGIGGLGYNYVVTKHASSVELYIDCGKGSKAENKHIFDKFKQSQAEIEAVFGGSLEWERLDAKRACRIVHRFEGGGYRDAEQDWPGIQDTMIDAIIRLEKALAPHVAALKGKA